MYDPANESLESPLKGCLNGFVFHGFLIKTGLFLYAIIIFSFAIIIKFIIKQKKPFQQSVEKNFNLSFARSYVEFDAIFSS